MNMNVIKFHVQNLFQCVSQKFVCLKRHSCGSRACPALDAGNPCFFKFWFPVSTGTSLDSHLRGNDTPGILSSH